MQLKRTIVQDALSRITGRAIDLDDAKIKGRNVYGRVAFEGRPGVLYVETSHKDGVVNDGVMPTITKEDAQSPFRYQIYTERCQDLAKEINRKQIGENDLILLVAFNGLPTKTAKILFHALLNVNVD